MTAFDALKTIEVATIDENRTLSDNLLVLQPWLRLSILITVCQGIEGNGHLESDQSRHYSRSVFSHPRMAVWFQRGWMVLDPATVGLVPD